VRTPWLRNTDLVVGANNSFWVVGAQVTWTKMT